ncbi:MAG: PfkB family carbohydrate kinase, partial [Planctomycetota bacterium]
ETVHEKREDQLGGSATYCALASSAFTKPRLVSVVGDDFQEAHMELLQGCGVDTAGLEVATGGKTFRWGGRYEPDWNTRHTTDTQLGVLEHFDPKLPSPFSDSRFVFLANAAPAVQAKALDQVDGPTFSMLDTMNLWIDIALDDLKAVLRRIDAVVLNDEEARMLTGESNLIRAAQQVLGMGPRYVILKKGEHGAFLMGEDAHFALPAFPVTEVIDPTGAGDSFAGGFMGHLARTGKEDPKTLREAMLYGTVTASFCVESFSVDGLCDLSMDSIEQRADLLRSIVTL